MFKRYELDARATSSTTARHRNREEENEAANPRCCCCKASHVILATSVFLFIMSLSLMLLGFYMNNEVRGWSLSAFELLGFLCIAVGAFSFVLSATGIMAARSKNKVITYAYFLQLLLLVAFLICTFVYGIVENANISDYLDKNWDAISDTVGFTGERDEVEQSLHDWFYGFVAIGSVGTAVLSVSLVSAMRMLGLRAIAISTLVTLGMLGFAEFVLAFFTAGSGLPGPTTWLLFGCSVVQVICAACGICGFRNLNRECMFWFFIILLIASCGLLYVAVDTYLWMRDHDPDHPEQLLIVFAITLVSIFLMWTSLLFGGLFYCKRRKAFKDADRRAELPVHFSDYGSRQRGGAGGGGGGGGRRGGGRRPGRVREYNARSAL